MTEIRPFRGWHYSGEVSDLIAPPYDILSADAKRSLLARSGDNIVAVDLPHVPPKDVGPAAAYQAAAEKLSAMQAAGVLVREAAPALYAYSQSYTWAGRSYTRKMLMGGVRATELCEGVWPHENTFAGPKADRLKLTEVTGMQLSPIFAFFDDTGGAGQRLWADVADREPAAAGELDGTTERLWAVTDPDVVAGVCEAAAGVPIFIADGHHRYTTALNYIKALRKAGRIDADHPANFVLFALAAMDDPGLLVLPTHRLVSGCPAEFDAAALAAATAAFTEWKTVEITDRLLDDPDGFLAAHGPHAMAFLDAGLDGAHVARVTDPSVMARLAPQQNDTWRQLDVAILHEAFLGAHVAPRCGDSMAVTYTAYGREVVDALRGGECQLAVMLQSTPLAAVKEIALAHAVMPPKSTYFYPKLATGMVLKPLT